MSLSKKAQELIGAVNQSRQALVDAVSGLSEAQLTYRPEDGAWTISDILHHMALTDEANTKLTFRALKHARERDIPADPTPDGSVLNCLEGFLAPITGQKAQAPDSVTPREHAAADHSLERLEASRARMLENVEQLTRYDLEQLKYPHPLLGELNMYQWILIAGGHERRHAAQIGRIKATPGFPNNS